MCVSFAREERPSASLVTQGKRSGIVRNYNLESSEECKKSEPLNRGGGGGGRVDQRVQPELKHSALTLYWPFKLLVYW
jgi:hypothetical protein